MSSFLKDKIRERIKEIQQKLSKPCSYNTAERLGKETRTLELQLRKMKSDELI